MATTAKTIQLLDTYHNYISPATNIESLYYEKSDGNLTYRCSVWQNFPVYVNYGDKTKSSSISAQLITTADPQVSNLSNTSNGYIKLQYLNDDKTYSDILISTINDRLIEGTAYHALDVCTYNLTQILSGYCTVPYMEARVSSMHKAINSSINELSTYISNTATAITKQYIDLSTNLKGLLTEYQKFEDIFDIADKIYTYEELSTLATSGKLYAGCIYKVYYNPGAYVKIGTFFLNFNSHEYVLSLLATSKYTFSSEVQSVYDKEANTYMQWKMIIDFYHKYYFLGANGALNTDYLFSNDGLYEYNGTTYVMCTDPNKTIWFDPHSLNHYYYTNNSNILKSTQKVSGITLETDYLTYMHVTYLRDENGNEAPYDFKLRLPELYTNATVPIYNNVIKTIGNVNINCNNCQLNNTYIGYNNYQINIETINASTLILIGNNNTSIHFIYIENTLLYIKDSNSSIMGTNVNDSIITLGSANSSILYSLKGIIDIKDNNYSIQVATSNTIGSHNSNLTVTNPYNIINNYTGYIMISGSYNTVNNYVLGSATNLLLVTTNNNILDNHTKYADWNQYKNDGSIWFTYKNIVAKGFEVL